jgi:ABC-type lipoprotein release transport system permease subunit
LLGRALQSQLHGVRADDPLTLAIVLSALAIAGIAAIWRPARRAASTDPMVALREE